jgi:hypothetical protein
VKLPQNRSNSSGNTHNTSDMSTEEGLSKPAKQAKEDFAVISNRLAVAFAKRESLIKSWTASSSKPPAEPTKTEEELEAEDTALFRNQPPYLGVGAAIPSHFLVSEAERNNKSLRAKFFPTKGLKASKARDAEEKAASVKRGLKDQSSDEEEGRSGLGRAKKLKLTKKPEPKKKPIKDDSESEEESRATLGKAKKLGGMSTESIPSERRQASTKSSDKLENEAASLKVQSPESSTPEAVSKLNGLKPTDPAELKRWKKREKRQRKKLKEAQKEVKE